MKSKNEGVAQETKVKGSEDDAGGKMTQLSHSILIETA